MFQDDGRLDNGKKWVYLPETLMNADEKEEYRRQQKISGEVQPRSDQLVYGTFESSAVAAASD